jgi:hypothetical protein
MLQREYEEGGAELIVHIGDISYANGREEVCCAPPMCRGPAPGHSRAPRQAPAFQQLLSLLSAYPCRLFAPFRHLLALMPVPSARASCLPTSALLPLLPQIWDAFMESVQPFAAHIPYMVGAGNHGELAG